MRTVSSYLARCFSDGTKMIAKNTTYCSNILVAVYHPMVGSMRWLWIMEDVSDYDVSILLSIDVYYCLATSITSDTVHR